MDAEAEVTVMRAVVEGTAPKPPPLSKNDRERVNNALKHFATRGWAADQALAIYIPSRFFPTAASKFRRFVLRCCRPELASALAHMGAGRDADEFLFPLFAEFCFGEFPEEIRSYRDLVNSADMTKPHVWYPQARAMPRKVVYHMGPTNSGKTHRALVRFKEASSGTYCGPLRLLAMEVFDRVNADGVYCNLVTGQERKEMPFAHHTACTIEMANLSTPVDVAVIDEIQMVSDDYRGWAWTRALLGVQAAEVHVCGDPSVLPLLRAICDATGDAFECHHYHRFAPLTVDQTSLQGDLGRVSPGDCIVAFSRREIFEIKRAVEMTTKHRCCVVYGALPPETRRQQARLFNEEESDFRVLVASDAIGMGLNLSIRRVIFSTLHKFNGEEKIRIPSPMVSAGVHFIAAQWWREIEKLRGEKLKGEKQMGENSSGEELRGQKQFLSPQFLSPQLSPQFLSPQFLSPQFLSHQFLSHQFLSPQFLSHQFLSPQFLSPKFLSPQFLSPQFLSPQFLSPQFFSPQFLSPQFLSPQFLSPQFLSPQFLSLQFLSPQFLSPQFLSPQFLSPQFLSPQFLSPQSLSPPSLPPSLSPPLPAFAPNKQVKQIAGRAGRRGSRYEEGVVTCLDPTDMPLLIAALQDPVEPTTAAGLFPLFEQVEVFASQLPDVSFARLLDRFVETSKLDGTYFLCRTDNIRRVATMLDKIKGLTLRDRFAFCSAPANARDPTVMAALLRFAHEYAEGKPVPLLAGGGGEEQGGWEGGEAAGQWERGTWRKTAASDLMALETKHQVASLYLWLSYQFPKGAFPDASLATDKAQNAAKQLSTALLEARTPNLSSSFDKPGSVRGRYGPGLTDLQQQQLC
ncbi:unnamed protein product [Closterium sp. Yama58-4]|nr:unnamed protein product [Closterium sp. Yama58-4]